MGRIRRDVYAKMGWKTRWRHKQLIEALNKTGWKCAYCGVPLMLDDVLGPDIDFWKRQGLERATADHIIPKALGGSNSQENITASCYVCNTKHPKNPQTPKGTKRGFPT